MSCRFSNVTAVVSSVNVLCVSSKMSVLVGLMQTQERIHECVRGLITFFNVQHDRGLVSALVVIYSKVLISSVVVADVEDDDVRLLCY